MSKRIIDLILGFTGILITALLFLPVAAAIKLDSPGPVFFKQNRVSKNGKIFRFYKFRTMFTGSSFTPEEMDRLNEAHFPLFKMKNDPRITRTGKFLRKYSIDEFPQFWNVLKGEMSIVGPRPPLVHEVENYNEHQKKRLSVKQGITGLWQVSGRSNVYFDRMVNLDIYYIENRSLWLDIKIILKTIPEIFIHTGAY
ncbi:MAG: sugar transferase [Fibrobacterota bacterium]